MQKLLTALRGFIARVGAFLAPLWRRFRALPRYLQWVIGIVVVGAIIALFAVLHSSAPTTTENLRAVTLRSVAELSGNASSGTMFGSVRSRSEAEILSEAGGTVRAVHTTLGGSVGAGMILAELENASEQAALLQAEGAYDAAVAAQKGVAVEDKEAAARAAYQSAFNDLDIALETYVDQVFGPQGPFGPSLVINANNAERLSRERQTLKEKMDAWRRELATANGRDAEELLAQATAITQETSTFLTDLARSANMTSSGATSAQLSALATARTSVDGASSSLAAASAAFRSGSVSATAGADASVKQALGSLRLAQANVEKTLIRAPIGGTVNFFPLHVGDYVTNLSHVATVAQNNALEIVAYVSEEGRESLTTGVAVMVDGKYPGTITSIAPALDPITKQIEVHVAVASDSGLVNGQSVRVDLPEEAAKVTATADAVVYLPLAAVKLRPQDRVVFTVDEEGRLGATVVETGEVSGDRIQILTALPQELRIVSDARGLAEGQKVRVAP